MALPRADEDALMDSLARAARRAGHEVERVPAAVSDHRRKFRFRRLRIDGRLHAVHFLAHVRRRQNRRVEYVNATLGCRRLETVPFHLFCLLQYRRPKYIVVSSTRLLKFFFDGTGRRRYTCYINLAGTPGASFDFWQYQADWG